MSFTKIGHSPRFMRKEKIILSFVAAFIGVLVAVLGFFFYQSTKAIKSSDIKKIQIINPTPTPSSSVFLTVDNPGDEEVVGKRIITVSGKTSPGAKIVVVTQSDEQGAVAANDGSFSTEITLDQDENIIEVTAIGKNGESVKVKRTVTYSTESF